MRTAGWRVFVAYCTREFKGDGFFARMGTATKAVDPVAAKLVYNTALEVERLLQWVPNRILELQGVVDE